MIAQLKSKLEANQAVYSQEEVEWLMNNIGHKESAIRDQLVYATFARGLQRESFTREQLRYFLSRLIEENLILFHFQQIDEALTRSFSLLLVALVLNYDNHKESLYYMILDNKEYNWIVSQVIKELETEENFCGYSKDTGWVHVFAHGQMRL